MNARDEILRRVRTALADVPAAETAEEVAVPRGYRRRHHDKRLTDLFAERVADYRAEVARVTEAKLPAAVAATLAGRPSVVVPDGVPDAWLSALDGVEILRDTPPLDHAALDKAGAVLTGCAVGVAETGTIILDAGPAQGRRALSLLPDFHLCVVRLDQVVADWPEAVAALDPTRPLTLISGPSATSDIELNRVEGVHGPRTLHVLLLSRPRKAA
ncbi:MAG: lactate utilization protein C [Mycobacteriales bacterium]